MGTVVEAVFTPTTREQLQTALFDCVGACNNLKEHSQGALCICHKTSSGLQHHVPLPLHVEVRQPSPSPSQKRIPSESDSDSEPAEPPVLAVSSPDFHSANEKASNPKLNGVNKEHQTKSI